MEQKSNTLEAWIRSRFVETIPRREGAHAIYMERPEIMHVRVSNIRHDDSGMSAAIDQIAVVLTTDPKHAAPSSWEVSAAWEVLSLGPEHWKAHYVSWSLCFDQEKIKAVLETAPNLKTRPPILAWMQLSQILRPSLL
jgi:hypothetical protein